MGLNMMKTIVAAAVLAAVSLLAPVANAATVSQFHLAPAINLTNFKLTVVNASTMMLDFDPSAPQNIFLSSQTGVFTPFSAAQLFDITNVATAATSGPGGDVLLDLGTAAFPANPSTSDGLNTFAVSQTGPLSLVQSGSNVAIDFALVGEFNIGGDLLAGAGTLTFQVANTTVGDVNTILTGGGTLSNLTFSGALFTVEGGGGGNPIPAPAAVSSGLGLLSVLILRNRLNRR